MNRVAIITGGARGIGLGVSKALARDGFQLVLSGVRPEDAVGDPLRELREGTSSVLYIQADVTDPDARERLVSVAEKQFGRIDVLVNNAGVAPEVRADLLDMTETSYQRVMKTNLEGPFFLTQLVARRMVDQRRADPSSRTCIINVSSISATVTSINRGEYCISKAGVSMATRLWAVRLAEFGIPVYEIRPGVIRTDMTASVTGKYDAMIDAGLMLEPRWGEPQDIGRAAAMLARGDLTYATGQVLVIDGGLTLQRL